MADSLEVTVGRIDERTAAIQNDIAEIKCSCNTLFSKSNNQEKRLTTLEVEHADRKESGACAPAPSHKASALSGGISGAVTAILIAVIEYLRNR